MDWPSDQKNTNLCNWQIEDSVAIIMAGLQERGVDFQPDFNSLLPFIFPQTNDPKYGDLKHARYSVAAMAEQREGMEEMLENAEQAIERWSKRIETLILSRNISNLPDEILGMIFELACLQDFAGEYWSETPWNIAYVCRRFRQIALRLPVIWASISSTEQSFKEVRILVSLNRFKDFRVFFKGLQNHPRDYYENDQEYKNIMRQEYRRMEMMWNEIVPLAPHISELHISLATSYTVDIRFQQLLLRREFSELAFPSLRKLHLCDIEVAVDNENVADDDFYIPFYKKWHLPAMRTLRVENAIPTFREAVFAHLQKLTLELGLQLSNSDSANVEWSGYSILDFVRQLYMVPQLDIKLRNQHLFYATDLSDDEDSDDEDPPVKEMQTQTLSLLFKRTGLLTCESFLKAFTFPELSLLRIDIALDSTTTTSEALKTILPLTRSMPKLENLTIKIHVDQKSPDLDKPPLLAAFGANALHHFELEVVPNVPDLLNFRGRVQRIEVKGCQGAMDAVMNDIVNEDRRIPGNSADGKCLSIVTLEEWKRIDIAEQALLPHRPFF